MQESQVGFVYAQGFSIDFSLMRHPVTIGAESNEVFISVFSSLLHKNDMVNIDIDVATGRDGTPMPCFHKDAPTYISAYCGPRTAQFLPPEFIASENDS